MCENTGQWVPNGHCGKAKYCAGPNIIEDAACGKKELCASKGNY